MAVKDVTDKQRHMNYVSYLHHCPGYLHTPFPWQRYILSHSSPLDKHSATHSDQECTSHFRNRDLGNHLKESMRKKAFMKGYFLLFCSCNYSLTFLLLALRLLPSNAHSLRATYTSGQYGKISNFVLPFACPKVVSQWGIRIFSV